jgi:hypothetical protein
MSKKSNSSNETPNVITVGVENYGLTRHNFAICKATEIYQYETESSKHQDSNYVLRMLIDLVGYVTICFCFETATFCELQLQIPNLHKHA